MPDDGDEFISRDELYETLFTLAKKLMSRSDTKQALLVLDLMHAFKPKPAPIPEPADETSVSVTRSRLSREPGIDFLNLPLRDPNACGPVC